LFLAPSYSCVQKIVMAANEENLPPIMTIHDVQGLSKILGKDSSKLLAQGHFMSFLIRKFSQKRPTPSRSVSYSKGLASVSGRRSDSDFLPSGSLQSIFTMHTGRNNDVQSSKKVFLTSSSKCLSREFFDSGMLGGSDLATPSKDDLDALILEEVPNLTMPDQQISIVVTAPSDLTGPKREISISPDLDRDWSPPTRAAAKTIWDDNSMIDLMQQFENSSEIWEDNVQVELKEDPVLWCLSKDAREQLQNPGQVVEMLHELQRSINLIDRFIPELTSNLSSDKSDVYMTNVIQELLKRAQESQLSSKIRNDFSSIKYNLEAQSLYSEEDIEKMVKLIAWIRNNITASAVTDENDAKMASMGAREVQQSLKTLLKIQADMRSKATNNTAAHKNLPREDSSKPLRHLSA